MSKKLGLGSLVALVIGSMMGAGVFSLPQNMAAVASPLAIMIGWLITGVGMIFLALSFQRVSEINPEIDSGVFGFAAKGFGDFAGFCSAWGYSLSAIIANVSYLIIVFSTLGMLFDTPTNVLFGDGNTLLSIACASVLLWICHWLIGKGVSAAALVNLITLIARMIPLFFFIIVALFAFHWDMFTFDFTGTHFGPDVGLWGQVKNTMLITVWVFIGIEGAVIVSSRAKCRKDVARATILGLLVALSIYVLVSLISFGVLKPTELASYQNPSMAQVLSHIIGPIGKYIIGTGLVISVCGAFLSWTLLASEAPLLCARDKLFPECFAKVNKHGSPVNALRFTNVSIQIGLIFVFYAKSTYNSLLPIVSEMVLVPYLLVGLYMLMLAVQRKNRGFDVVVGACASLYGFWLLYASGLNYLLLSALMYLPGLLFLMKARHEQQRAFFNQKELIWVFILALVALSAVGSLFFS